MTEQRATTAVDAGVVRVSNRWLARSWTAFSGVTMELQQFPGTFEWTSQRSPEFFLETNRGVVGYGETMDVEWTEELNRFGAAVAARRTGDGIEVVLRTFIFHDFPCLLRRCTVHNTSEVPLRVTRCAPDVLALRTDGTWVRTHQLEQERESISWESDEDKAAILSASHGIIFGMAGGAQYELYEPDPAVCAAYTREAVVIPPLRHWTAPETYLAVFTGELQLFLSRTWADIQRAIQQLRDLELHVK